MKKILIFSLFTSLLTYGGCKKDDWVDDILPTIDISADNAFPHNCDTLYLGETAQIVIKLNDNKELGSYSIDIHNNFDHHSHTTEVIACEDEADKIAVNPFLYIQSFSLPDGLTSYETNLAIQIPADADPGDYHFLVRVTDNEGWQALKGLSIKLVQRN
jgi:hypothetical protein